MGPTSLILEQSKILFRNYTIKKSTSFKDVDFLIVYKYLNNSDLESRKPREIITKIDEFKKIIYPLQSSTNFA